MQTTGVAGAVRVTRCILISFVGVVMLASAPAQARIAVTPNWRMDTAMVPGRGEDSVGLAVDPSNPNHIVEVDADWEAGQCDHHVSFDGGRTWTGGHFRTPSAYEPQPCAVGPHLAENMQAGIAYGSRGNVYATFASSRVLPDGTFTGKTLFVAVSRDGGRKWGVAHAVALGGPTLDPGPNYALPTIGVYPARRRGPRHDIVYVAADTTTPAATHPVTGTNEQTTIENIAMAVSKNGGTSWGKAFNVNAPNTTATEPSQPVVGADGTVYIAWREISQAAIGHEGSPPPSAAKGFIVVAHSRDRGRTWTRVDSTVVQGYIYNGPPTPPFTTVPAVFTASTFPRLAIDPRKRFVYLVFGQGPPLVPFVPGHAHRSDHFINPASAVYLQRSGNGGVSWSDPKHINTAAPLGTNPTQTRHPSVFVAPNGRVDIVWQDRRNWYRGCPNTHTACEEARLGDTYYAYSSDHGRTFSRNYRLSDRSTNNDVGYDYRFGTYWTYGPQVAPMGNNRLLVAWMESRRGNVQNDSQDIYLTRVSLNARGPVPVRHMRTVATDRFSVALSRFAYPGGPEAVLSSTFVSRPWTRVVIVNDRDVAGALAGGVLARANIGPVLTSPSGGLSAAVKTEVHRLQPVGAYVIGSETKLSAKVLSDLAAAGVPSDQIVRLSGAGVADTARLIAAAADRRTPSDITAGEPAFDAAIIANPTSRDAVNAAVLAADRRLPVLYVTGGSVPAATTSALSQLAIKKTLVIGDRREIGGGVLAHLPSPIRLSGRDIYGTSRAVVRQSILRGVPDNIVYVTNGKNAMETALLGAAIGRSGGVLLIAPSVAAARTTIAHTPVLRGDATQVVVFGM